jgi:thiol-disulfide isomerase/thioredoxin
MKTILFALVVLQLSFRGIPFSQIPNEAFKYSNKIYGLWNAAQFDTAIDYSVRLVKLNPSMFEEIIHNQLSQGILSKEQHHNSATFLKLLYQTNNRDINQIIAPIHTLNSIIETNNKDSVVFLAKSFLSLLSNTSNYSSKAESYGLLVLKQMDAKDIHNVVLKRKLIDKIIHNIESGRCIDSTSVKGRNAEARRAWNRYVLSYSYFLLYQLDPDDIKAEDNLKLAVKYSPDIIDKQVHWAYFYEAGLLTGNPEEVGFEWLYTDFLMRKNRKNEALSIVTKRAVSEATNTNCGKLQALYKEVGYDEPFAKYWLEAINNISKVTPTISVRFVDDKTVDFGKPSGKWTYIDVWGTWCSPCREELPELEKAYQENLAKSETILSIYTLSHDSKNIKEFMTTNKYSFPVAEIDSSVVEAFNVDGYPTKILITPQGKYLKIPFGVDWREYLKNYCMIKY